MAALIHQIDEVEQFEQENPLQFKDIVQIINEMEQVSRSAPYFVTVTDWTKTGHNDWFQQYVSDPADLLDYVEMTGLDGALTHCFLGVQMINHRGEVTFASAGTFYVQVRTVNTALWEDAPVDHAIDATAPDTLAFERNVEGVRVRPTSLAGITSWRVFLTCNRR